MQRWHDRLARLGIRTAAGRDALVAVAVAVMGLVRVPYFLRGGPIDMGMLVAANAAATADLLVIGLRRRAPRTALGIALAIVLGSILLPGRYPFSGVGLVVCIYTVATLLPRRSAVLALAAAAVVHAVGGFALSTLTGGDVYQLWSYWGVPGDDAPDLVTATVATFGIAGFLGTYMQTRRAYTSELEARAARLEVEREERALKAVAEERGRIARELHDIAAHDLSAIVVQAGAADRLVDGDPAAAKATLQAIRSQGRDTLSSLRRLVGIMREVDTDGRAPQPSLLRLDDLVGAAREAGMTVEVTTSGQGGPLPPSLDLTAYRVVQEALTNARRHADGAPVTVCIAHDEELHVVVRNARPATSPDPSAAGAGHGLLGMRERVQQAGGRLDVGATEDGGWQVEAHLPGAR